MNYIEKTLFQVLKENAERFPDKEFVIYADRNLRFTCAAAIMSAFGQPMFPIG